MKKNGNNYLVLDDVDENKEKNWIRERFSKKNRFESNDDLPLNKPIKLRLLTIIIRSVFSEVGKIYPQLFLDDPLYELV